MSKQLIKKAQDEIVQDKEDEIVNGIQSKIESIKSKEEQIIEIRKEVKGLKKDLVDIEAEDYSSIDIEDGTSTTVCNPWSYTLSN